MLHPSLEMMMLGLSASQRDYLGYHVDGLRPFVNAPIENRTRRSLVERGLIHYVPETRSRLGMPEGTRLTDDGREVLCALLDHMADSLTAAMRAKEAQRFVDPLREMALRQALADTAKEWKRQDVQQQQAPPPLPIGHAYDRPFNNRRVT